MHLSPCHAVSRERIAVSSTVTRTATVVMETPVAHHAPLAVGSAYARFANAVAVGGVTQRAPAQVKGHRPQGVAAACWGTERTHQTNNTYIRNLLRFHKRHIVPDTAAVIGGQRGAALSSIEVVAWHEPQRVMGLTFPSFNILYYQGTSVERDNCTSTNSIL